ncbi:LVIVD repeat-containing protein [Myxococcus sp. Y35]|uniref:LVIVD repeat-containing protein n=1 Tax=Pseudomyxococcus flavus TaxID=3115648 RepID=UPI003CE7622E
MKRLLAITSTLALVTACGNDNPSAPKAECQLEAIDLSACQLPTLAAVQPEGIWNLNINLNDGSGAAAAMRLSGGGSNNQLLLGVNATERQSTPESFFLASEYQQSPDLTIRFAVAGCSSTGPGQMSGIFRRCANGAVDMKGTFDAVRLGRRAGEEEASGVELVAEVALTGATATNVAVANGHAFVTAGAKGLYIFDLSNPAQPRQVAMSEPPDDYFTDALVNGQTLYVASRRSGVIVYDVSNPANIVRLRSVPESVVEVNALALDGNVLYAASPAPNAEVYVYDVATPAEPKQLTRYFVEGAEPRAGEVPLHVTAMGGRLYVSNWSYGMTVSDVTTPSNPKLLGRFGSASSRATAVGMVGDRTLAFDVGEDWGAHLSVLDVGMPATVSRIGEYRTRPEVSIRSVALSGTRAYIAYGQDGLRVVDVSVPGEPRQVGYYNTWRESDPGHGVAFLEGLSKVRAPGDGFVYATDSARGLLIFRDVVE